MSLSLDVARVIAVLLSDGRWHKIDDGSFNLHIGDFVGQGRSILREAKAPPTIMAQWRGPEPGEWYTCPLSAVVAFRFMTQEDLPDAQSSKRGWAKLDDVERNYILRVFHAQQQDVGRTADVLGIHRKTLIRKLREYGTITPSTEGDQER